MTVENSFDDSIKRDAAITLIQVRMDVEVLVKRMKALEGDSPASDDSYRDIAVAFQRVLQRIQQVVYVAGVMVMREHTGIRPELN